MSEIIVDVAFEPCLQLPWRYPLPAQHDAVDAATVADVVERVGIEQHEVGVLADRNRTGV